VHEIDIWRCLAHTNGVIMTRSFRLAGVVLVLMLSMAVGACGGLLGPRDDDSMRELLESRERLWRERAPSAYTMTVVRITQQVPEPQHVLITVSGQEMESAVYADTGEPLPENVRALYFTVEGLFALLRDAMARNVASTMSVRYDADYGFPAEFLIDYDTRRTDDDVSSSCAGLATRAVSHAAARVADERAKGRLQLRAEPAFRICDNQGSYVRVGRLARTFGRETYSCLQKGGDPAAGSPTATLLRLRPSHRTCLRPLPPCG
jgi:hypothetical protein